MHQMLSPKPWIERGVAIPSIQRRGGRAPKVGPLLEQMKPGDSVLCDVVGLKPNSLRRYCDRVGKAVRVTVRKTPEGYRAWRTA